MWEVLTELLPAARDDASKALRKKLSLMQEETTPAESGRRIKELRSRYLELKLEDPSLSASYRLSHEVGASASFSNANYELSTRSSLSEDSFLLF